MKKYIYFLFLLVSLAACEKIDTLIPNESIENQDVQAILEAGYLDWWNANHNPHTVLSLSVAADAYGLSRGAFGTIEMGHEPRKAYDNQVGNLVAENAWYNNLRAVAKANEAIIISNRTQNGQELAAAHFLRGIAWGYLGLIFDQVILTDTTTSKEVVFTDYSKAIDRSIEELELAIELAEITPNFQHSYFNDVLLNQQSFIALAHAYAARFIVQKARTEEERQNTFWELAYYHTDRGIIEDFAPTKDEEYFKSYQQYVFANTDEGPFWARVDQRLVASMDESQPINYPSNEIVSFNPIAQSNDARLATDFIFQERIFFKEALGTWHFSHYQHNRNSTNESFTGKIPTFLVTDNVLLQAEAALELGGQAEAIQLLNQSARTQRGQLPPLQGTISHQAVLEAIQYERAIELLSSAPMSLWFDRRRWAARATPDRLTPLGGLQVGTPAQLPVPAKELRLHSMDIYTFGGADDPMGVNKIVQ